MNAQARKLRPVETGREAQPDAAPDEVPSPAEEERAEPRSAESRSAEPVAERPRRRLLRRVATVALPLTLAVGGGYLWVTGGRYVSTEDAYVQQDRITIMPQVSGDIASVNVHENDAVAAGEVLFTIDDAVYRNAVEAARARLASARLDVEKLKTDYDQAVTAAQTAKDALETALTQNERQQLLLKRGVIAQAAADESELALQRARGASIEAESAVAAARAALAGDPDIETDRHPDVLQALAQLHSAELDLEHTVVRAPIAAVVSQTDRLQPGQYVTPATAVLALVDAADSYVEANYKETDLNHMVPGQPATVEIDAYPDRVLDGRVASIGAGTGSEFALLPAQNATGNWVKVVQRVPVRIAIADGQPMPPLRSGMSTQVEVDTGEPRGLPDIVTSALDALGLDATFAATPDAPAASPAVAAAAR
jgi:membrane fusion protein, multidrug efflux system